MSPALSPAALVYDDSAYAELQSLPGSGPAGGPMGLMGRQVAGREFLDAYFTHGEWSELSALVYNQASADSLVRFCEQHPSAQVCRRSVRVIPADRFRESFFPSPAAVLHTPCPPDPRFAWARQHWGARAFALSGVTHTLCTPGAVQVLGELLTAPFESFDALICTSSAVVRMVQAVWGAYGDYLRDRHGGDFRPRIRLETIPLGVNPEKFRPPVPEERARRRAALNISSDAVAVLCVGRFTPHAKAHPFPLLRGLARAAHTTGQRVHLILSGWAPNDALLQAYLDTVRVLAPGVPVSVVNGMDPDLRFGVWQAADVLTSLVDNIQETFGLVIIEAMASGLPVVASDWNGYRDLVVNGETGFLTPTRMVRDATADSTTRLLLGIIDYDAFLAECNQAAAVDSEAAAEAFGLLFTDWSLRQRMGIAGRQRVQERFTWERVVREYEKLWRSQEAELLAYQRAAENRKTVSCPPLPQESAVQGPACYPAPECSFAGYPSEWVDDGSLVQAVPNAVEELVRYLSMPLFNYADGSRTQDAIVLRAVLSEGEGTRTIAELEAVLRKNGIPHVKARATLAWLLKYELLRLQPHRE